MQELEAWLSEGPARRVVAVSGAGLSAASGIPTFRGPAGYWTVGSEVYRAQELATHAAFEAMPREVWRWYLYRRGVCRAAAPNAAHLALAKLEGAGEGLADADFALLSQNVDGLHLRAGNSAHACFEIHGNIDFMRCADDCSTALVQVPSHFDGWTKEQAMRDEDFVLLRCPKCRGPARPHILWFDEVYEESLYRAESAINEAARSHLIVFVGCSGAASLPWRAAQLALRSGARMVDINTGDNPFGEMADEDPRSLRLRGPADLELPRLVDALLRVD